MTKLTDHADGSFYHSEDYSLYHAAALPGNFTIVRKKRGLTYVLQYAVK